MSDGNCGTCRWWQHQKKQSSDFGVTCGYCRRYAPRTVYELQYNNDGTVSKSHVSMFPLVGSDDWCGEHTPKEPTP